MSRTGTKATLKHAAVATAAALRWYPVRRACPLIREALRTMTADQLVYAVNISRRYRYVYMENPKTGCSSLKSALAELESKGRDAGLNPADWNNYHDRSISPFARLDDLRDPESLSSLLRRKYKFISFVRNPYTRLLSCYRDKILGNGEQKRPILDRLGRAGAALDTPVSFAEFVAAVIGQSDLEMNPHWRVQTSHILHPLIPYDFIGRFERYVEDYAECFRVLGIPAEEIPEYRHFNRSRGDSGENCRKYYDSGLQEQVYRRYQKDFELLGYPYDLPE